MLRGRHFYVSLLRFRHTLALLLCSMGTGLVVSAPSSANLTYVSDDRSFDALFCDSSSCTSTNAVPTPPFSDFSYLGRANFDSQLLPDAMTASLVGLIGSFGIEEETSTFDVTFAVDASVAFTFTSVGYDGFWGPTFAYTGTEPDPTLQAVASFQLTRLADGVELFDESASAFVCSSAPFGDCEDWNLVTDISGVLEPGQYRLFAVNDGSSFGSGEDEFDFALSISSMVPEPTTGLCVGLGLLQLAWSRRHARRSSVGPGRFELPTS